MISNSAALATLLALLSSSVALGGKSWRTSLEDYTFEDYLNEFRMKFPPFEMELRKANFNAEVSRVKNHNMKNLGWKEGINRYSAWKPEEKKALLGRVKGVKRNQKKLLKNQKLVGLPDDVQIKPISSLPTSVDWREKDIMSAVKDQGHCGSCWSDLLIG